MSILLSIDPTLYIMLFCIAGTTGLLVRIDQWVEGNYTHPQKNGYLDIWKSFWAYILTFILSGITGIIVSIGSGYFFQNLDSNILIFIAIMSGAIGRILFYKLVEWVHQKFDSNINSSKPIEPRERSRRRR